MSTERHLKLQLHEKDDIIRDQQDQIDRLRKQLIRLEIGKETMERKQEYTGKSAKKVYEGMEPIYRKLKEKDFSDWQDIRRYLKSKLVDEEGNNLDEYKVREMMDYLNAKVFQVFGGVGKGRQKLILKHRGDDEEPFSLTITKVNGKGRYSLIQQLDNVSKALDIHFHPDHGRKIFQIKEDEEPPSTTTTSLFSSRKMSSSPSDEEISDQKVTKSRWYRIDNNDQECTEKCNQGGSGGWRRITNNDDVQKDSNSNSSSSSSGSD